MDERELDAYLHLVEFGIHREMFDHPETQDVVFEDEQEWELMDELA
jgi:hypothetical protein